MKNPIFFAVAFMYSSVILAQVVSDGRNELAVTEIRAALFAGPPKVAEQASRDQLVRFVENLLIDKRLEQAAKSLKLDQDPEIAARMTKAVRDVLVKSYVEHTAAKISADLPDVEPLAKERYLVEKANLKRSEGVRVAHILFRVAQDDETCGAEARSKADQVLAELRDGADFSTMAKKHSQDSSASQGGELSGWREKGSLVPAFEKAAYALQPGELSGVVRSNFGYHIIKLLEHRPAAQISYDEAKEQLLQKIRAEFMEKRREEWIKQFRGSKPVEIDDATLEALRRK